MNSNILVNKMVYIPNDIFNIIKEYLISDYGSYYEFIKKILWTS